MPTDSVLEEMLGVINIVKQLLSIAIAITIALEMSLMKATVVVKSKEATGATKCL